MSNFDIYDICQMQMMATSDVGGNDALGSLTALKKCEISAVDAIIYCEHVML